jgi:hypothetical protein
MNINTWSELANLKVGLLNLADILLSDHVISNEEVALKLLKEIEKVNVIERDLIKSFCDNQLRDIKKKVASTFRSEGNE